MASLPDRVSQLIDWINQGKIVEAIDEFYAPDVEMRENSLPPTVGRDANREREKQFIASVKEWKSTEFTATAIDETAPGTGTAFIEYNFEFVNTEGQPVRYEQASVQRWQDGLIASERFYHG